MATLGLQMHLEQLGVELPAEISLERLALDQYSYVWTKDQWLVFIGWLSNNSVLFQAAQGHFSRSFEDQLNISKHTQAEGFKRFFTALVEQQLLSFAENADLKALIVALSFCTIVEDDLATRLQQKAVHHLDAHLDRLELSFPKMEWSKVVQQSDAFLNENGIALFRLLDHKHYRPITRTVELLSKQMYHSKATLGGMLQLVAFAERLPLETTHAQQLDTFKRELKQGKYVFTTTRTSWLRLSLLIVGALIALGILGLVFFIPVTSHPTKVQEETSYMSLSVQERRSIDSLLSQRKTMAQQRLQQAMEEEIPVAEGELVMGPVFKNPTFNDYYTTWRKKDSLPFAKTFSTAKASQQVLPQTLALTTRKGGIDVHFFNEFNLVGLVVVFSETAPYRCYSQFVAPGEQLSFKVNAADRLVVLPGSSIPKQLQKNGLPFEQVDDRFFSELETIYRVKSVKGPLKLVWKAAGNRQVFLVDLNAGLLIE